jgi:hypothetical protein
MYSNQEILTFDGTVQGLGDVLDLLQSTMPKCPAFVTNRKGHVVNRVHVMVKQLSDGSRVWDVNLLTDKEVA